MSLLSVAVGTTNAFPFDRHAFRGRGLPYLLALLPLVVPGIVLGISILVFSSRIATGVQDATGLYVEALRPGLALVISARLARFDRSLEEAARNLGAAPLTITVFDRLKEGSTPVLDAVSLLLMAGSGTLALVMIAFRRGS